MVVTISYALVLLVSQGGLTAEKVTSEIEKIEKPLLSVERAALKYSVTFQASTEGATERRVGSGVILLGERSELSVVGEYLSAGGRVGYELVTDATRAALAIDGTEVTGPVGASNVLRREFIREFIVGGIGIVPGDVWRGYLRAATSQPMATKYEIVEPCRSYDDKGSRVLSFVVRLRNAEAPDRNVSLWYDPVSLILSRRVTTIRVESTGRDMKICESYGDVFGLRK